MESKDRGQFSLLDYSYFVIVFVVSAGIGLYCAIKFRKTVTTIDDYLLGGRNIGLFPVICSLVATSVSGSSIIAISAEAYVYGTHTWMSMVSILFMPSLLPWVFLPVFSELKLTSSFKYFELRFNRRVRLLASGLFLISGLLYLPVTVYVAALTFQRVTGLNIYVTVTILSLLCASYTAIGGFKAVIWTDVVQLVLMLLSCSIVGLIGIQATGGFGKVFDAANRGGRIIIADIQHLNARTSFLGYALSISLVSTYQFGLNQTHLQRFLSLPSNKKMTISAWSLMIVFHLFMFLSPLLGIIMYANYETCDPFKAGYIKSVDQILPYFIQEKASLFLGFNGIFIAGIFSASLSTTSSYLNTMSGIIYEDFISQRLLDFRIASKIIKSTVYILGIIQIFLVFLIERMGMIAQITNQSMALNSGAMLTLFILGVLVPKANSTGAQWGAIAAFISVFTLIIGSINKKRDPMLPFRTDGCENGPLNSTLVSINDNSDDVFWIFKVSFIYYGIIGVFLGVTVGYLTSLLTGGNTIEDQRLLAPFLWGRQIRDEELKLRSGSKDISNVYK